MTERENAQADAQAVEFYAARVNAWMATKFELDKSLLTLSAAGIGLVITLISTVGVKSIESLILSILTLTSFVFCLASVLCTFKMNAGHLEKTVKDPSVTDDPILKILDHISMWSFVAGVLLACIIGFSTAINSYIEKTKKMTEPTIVNSTGIESLNGIMNMQPPQKNNTQANTTPPAAQQPTQNQTKSDDTQKGK